MSIHKAKAKITAKVKVEGEMWDALEEDYGVERSIFIEEVLIESGALFGSIDWSSRTFDMNIIDVKGRTIEVSQKGTWDNCYSFDFKGPKVIIDGDDYTHEFHDYIFEGLDECYLTKSGGFDITAVFNPNADFMPHWSSFMAYTFPK